MSQFDTLTATWRHFCEQGVFPLQSEFNESGKVVDTQSSSEAKFHVTKKEISEGVAKHKQSGRVRAEFQWVLGKCKVSR